MIDINDIRKVTSRAQQKKQRERDRRRKEELAALAVAQREHQVRYYTIWCEAIKKLVHEAAEAGLNEVTHEFPATYEPNVANPTWQALRDTFEALGFKAVLTRHDNGHATHGGEDYEMPSSWWATLRLEW